MVKGGSIPPIAFITKKKEDKSMRSKTVNFRTSIENFLAIKKIAEKNKRSISTMIDMIIEEYCRKEKNK